MVEDEIAAQERVGNEVQLFAAHTDTLEGDLLYPIRTALRVATGRGRNPNAAIRNWGADIVHIHNLFPNFGRRWVEDLDIPVIHTLHNFRPMCAAGTLFRNGRTCTLCPDGNRWSGLRYSCYRGSRLATFPLSWGNREGPALDPLLLRANRLITLSEQSKNIYVARGIPSDKFVVWPQFLPEAIDPGPPNLADRREGWLYVGRLSQEKGILDLIERWPSEESLQVVGNGELESRIREAAAGKEIALLGALSRSEVIRLMKQSIGLVFPSLCFEVFPLTYLEALATGLPVLAFEPNVVADFVKRDRTGKSVTWDSDIGDSLDEFGKDASDLAHECRKVFERIGSEPAYLDRARQIYSSVLTDPA